MKRFLYDRRVIAIGAALIVVLVCVGIALTLRSHPREVRLSDGTVLRLEKVSFGKRELLKPGGWFRRTKEAVASHLPKKWADRIITPATTNVTSWTTRFYAVNTDEPTLHIWVTRINAASGQYENVGLRNAELVDEDGCIIAASVGGGEDRGLLAPAPRATPSGRGGSRGAGGAASGSSAPINSGAVIAATGTSSFGPATQRSSVSWFSFDIFPRRDKEFKLRVYDAQRQLVAEFTVANPAPQPPKPASPSPRLPVAVTNGDVVFKLTNVSTTTLPGQPFGAVARPRQVRYSFETVGLSGAPVDWDPVAMDLWDSAGNMARTVLNTPYYGLCPRDPQWKLKVKFADRADDPAMSWTMHGVTIPERDSISTLQTNGRLGKLAITPIVIGGPGKSGFKSENNNPSVGSSSSTTSGNDFSMKVMRQNGYSTYELDSPNPYLAVKLDGLGDDPVTIAAVDEKGRHYYGQEMGGTRLSVGPLLAPQGNTFRYLRRPNQPPPGVPSPAFPSFADDTVLLTFNLPPGAKTIDLVFQVHRTRTVDFVFKPPPLDAK